MQVPQSFMTNHVVFQASFFSSRPQNYFDGTGKLKEKHKGDWIDVNKADMDNLTKFVLDCIEGHLIQNNSQVREIHVEKEGPT